MAHRFGVISGAKAVAQPEVTQKAESNGMPVTKVQAAFRLMRDELVVRLTAV